MNWELNLDNAEAELERRLQEVAKLRDDLEFYKQQIAKAIAAGKKAFDRDRYLKTRGSK